MERKEEVINALCQIVTTVGEYHNHEYAYDCFCTPRELTRLRYQFEDTILDFIRDAVAEKIARDGQPVSRFAEVN